MLAFAGTRYWWTPIATDALLRVVSGSIPSGNVWTTDHEKAVKAFQKSKGMTVDGDPGPNTVRELAGAVGGLTATPAEAAAALASVIQQAALALLVGTVAKATGSPWTPETSKLWAICTEWENAWSDACPAAAEALFFHGMSSSEKAKWLAPSMEGELGVIPLAAPLLLGGMVEGAAVAAAEVTVAALGSGVALGAAAWLAARVGEWSTTSADTAPEAMTAAGSVRIVPPAHLSRVGAPEPPRINFDFKNLNAKSLLRGIARFLALTVAWIVSGIGVAISLFGPVAAAAATAAGAALWWILAAAAAFMVAFKKRGRG